MSKNKSHILDPLWITKGSGDIDAEYLKYILLAANKKFREQLELGDLSKFNEIMFHSLNLNNLAVEGTVFDFKLNPKWDDPKLSEIRGHLRQIYQMPDNVIEIFRSANYLFTNLLIEYLDEINTKIQESQIYYMNDSIHREKQIFLILNHLDDRNYHIWKLRFDGRLKMGSRLEFIKTIKVDEEDDALKRAVDRDSDSILSKMNHDENVILILHKDRSDSEGIINSIASSISFSRGIGFSVKFTPNILQELQDLLVEERVMPFTIKSWK
jgi:hypothetical protein